MLTLNAIYTYNRSTASPESRTSSNHYGRFLSLRTRPNQLGRHWTWPGPRPHPNQMHHYSTLGPVTRATWRLVANTFGTVDQNHNFHRLCSAVVFQIVNRIRKDLGQPISDVAPPPHTTAPGNFSILDQALAGPPGTEVGITNNGPPFPFAAYVRGAPWVPPDAPNLALKHFRHFGTFLNNPTFRVDVTDQWAKRYGNRPTTFKLMSSGTAFMSNIEFCDGLEYFNIIF